MKDFLCFSISKNSVSEDYFQTFLCLVYSNIRDTLCLMYSNIRDTLCLVYSNIRDTLSHVF